jgi:transcriptional regulator with XRE-family HTH domain
MMGIPTIGQVGFPASAHFPALWENPTMPTTAQTDDLRRILPERIKARLDATGMSKRALSLAIGGHAGYIRDLFDPERFNVPSSLRLQAIARALETTTEYLIGEADSPELVASEVALSDRRFDWNGPTPSEPGIPLVGTGDCAALSLCTVSGEMVEIERSSFDPDYHVRYVRRPPALRGAREIYAIYFHGESMVPRFKPGEVGLVDPRRPVGIGDDVLVQLREDNGEQIVSVLVKELVRQSGRDIVLRQHNPPVEFTLPRTKVARMHRIVPQTELLF